MGAPSGDRGYRREWTIGVDDHASAYRARLEFGREIRRIAPAQAEHTAAELVFGELVHNAVRHAASVVLVELSIGSEALLRVTDDGPCFIMPSRMAVQPNAQSGRGLGIVRALARDLHVMSDAGRCVVTAVLQLDPVGQQIRTRALKKSAR